MPKTIRVQIQKLVQKEINELKNKDYQLTQKKKYLDDQTQRLRDAFKQIDNQGAKINKNKETWDGYIPQPLKFVYQWYFDRQMDKLFQIFKDRSAQLNSLIPKVEQYNNQRQQMLNFIKMVLRRRIQPKNRY